MISFIVIGENEGWKLTKCLKSIFETISYYNLQDTEVIYIDSISTDDSIYRAQAFKGVNIFQISGEINSAVARNVGAEKSKGDILFFIDGDMEIRVNNFKNFFDHKMERLLYPFISGDYINNYYENNISKELIYSSPASNIKEVSMEVTTGGLFFIERELWEEVGGMRNEFRRSQDLDLGLRLAKRGMLLKRLPYLLVDHHTIIYDKDRFWSYLKNGNFLFKGMLIRKHVYNKYIFKKMSYYDITLYILTLGLISLVFFHNYIFILLFLILTFIRVIRKSNLSNFFQNLSRDVLIDLNAILGFLFFYPKSEKIYTVKVIKQLRD